MSRPDLTSDEMDALTPADDDGPLFHDNGEPRITPNRVLAFMGVGTNQESEQPAHVDHPLDGYTYEGCPGCHAGPPLTTEEHDALPYDKPKPSEQPVAPVTEPQTVAGEVITAWDEGRAFGYREAATAAEQQVVVLRGLLDEAKPALMAAMLDDALDHDAGNALIEAIDAALNSTSKPESGTCWFCKGTFPINALIAGYDTWDEQRLACLACNERMQGNWRPRDNEPSKPESRQGEVAERTALLEQVVAAAKAMGFVKTNSEPWHVVAGSVDALNNAVIALDEWDEAHDPTTCVTTFLQSDRAERLLAEAVERVFSEAESAGYSVVNRWHDYGAADLAKPLLASLLEEMKK